MDVALSRLEARVFLYVMERVPAAANERCWEIALDPAGAPAAVASAPLASVPGAAVVFTLGRGGRRVIVTLTDAEPTRVAELLARAERDAPAGDAVRILASADPYLAQNGRAGIALLPPSAGRWFPDLPDAVRFDADLIQVSMAAFLTEPELTAARVTGPAALIAAFGRGERDLLRFAARPPVR
jgi:hypothetical protein